MRFKVAAPDATEIDAAILALGRELHARTRQLQGGLFDRERWQGALLDWVLRDPSFKVDLFRFVDVLPSLHDKEAVRRHVEEMLLRPGRALPAGVGAALKVAASGIGAGVAAHTLRKQVGEMAQRFIIGATPEEALPKLEALHAEGIGFTVDLLGEATLSRQEAERYVERYEALIRELPGRCAAWPEDEGLDRGPRGALPRCNISLKLSALEAHLDPLDHEASVERLQKRVLPLLRAAKAAGAFVNFDLEQWALHDIAYDLFENVVSLPEFRDWPHLGIVVQAYLRSAPADVERLRLLAKKRGTALTLRLVKGAYWDYEVIRARQQGWEAPVLLHKAQSDAQFEHLSRVLLQQHELLTPAFASHNLRSLLHAWVHAKRAGIAPRAFEFQMLYGMAEAERRALREMGARVRVYASFCREWPIWSGVCSKTPPTAASSSNTSTTSGSSRPF